MMAVGRDGLVRRRHVLYIEGYDPQGAEGYHGLFNYSFKRFLRHWPLKTRVSDVHIDSDDLAHWTIETAGPNWQVSTRYDFLRQEQMIRANMAQPMWRQVPRALWWSWSFLWSGTMLRILRASRGFALVLIHFQLLLIWWLVVPALGGWLAGHLTMHYLAAPLALAWFIGVVVALVAFRLLRPLANRWFVVQINSHWPYLIEYGRGEASCFEHPIEAGARRLVEIARANEADEVVVVGHSGGGVTAPAVVARALELDPELGRHGPRVVLLTPGSIMPGIGLHHSATRVRTDVARVSVEPSILWVDVQARADRLHFYNFDPVAGIGIAPDPRRCNPLVWIVRFREMLAPEQYTRLRWNFFRMHYQFIMGNEMRAAYEYMMLMCGPLPVEQWARAGHETLARFGPDGSYNPG
jgi:uncharacterized membrane protein YeaQ/YmgE (transglycosylase-associated protein family)